jgi:hypothetical protein
MHIDLVTDWRACWKWWSMRSLALSALVSGSWMALPPAAQAYLGGANTLAITVVIINFLGGFGRLIDQGDNS